MTKLICFRQKEKRKGSIKDAEINWRLHEVEGV